MRKVGYLIKALAGIVMLSLVAYDFVEDGYVWNGSIFSLIVRILAGSIFTFLGIAFLFEGDDDVEK